MRPAGEVTFQTDLPGNDYNRIDVQTVFECRDACFADSKCLAWTFVIAGYKEANAVCYFKNPVPATAYGNVCCSSGIAPAKVAAAPAPQYLLPNPNPAAGIDFAGTWTTQTSGGGQYRMLLQQGEGGQLFGVYGTTGAMITKAVIVGNELHGVWMESNGIGGFNMGRFTFTMLPGANAFEGHWVAGDRAVNPGSADGAWNGTREVAAAPAPAPAPAPAAGRGVILAAVDVYDAPGGGGNVLGFIGKDEQVSASRDDCQDGWCRISGPNVPGGEGWIWQKGFLKFL